MFSGSEAVHFGGFQSEKGKASGSAEKNRIWAVSGLQQFEERVYS